MVKFEIGIDTPPAVRVLQVARRDPLAGSYRTYFSLNIARRAIGLKLTVI
jgi:hypothetical protein